MAFEPVSQHFRGRKTAAAVHSTKPARRTAPANRRLSQCVQNRHRPSFRSFSASSFSFGNPAADEAPEMSRRAANSIPVLGHAVCASITSRVVLLGDVIAVPSLFTIRLVRTLHLQNDRRENRPPDTFRNADDNLRNLLLPMAGLSNGGTVSASARVLHRSLFRKNRETYPLLPLAPPVFRLHISETSVPRPLVTPRSVNLPKHAPQSRPGLRRREVSLKSHARSLEACPCVLSSAGEPTRHRDVRLAPPQSLYQSANFHTAPRQNHHVLGRTPCKLKK